MDKLQINRLRESIQGFDFKRLFIEELGWSNPNKSTKPHVIVLPEGEWQAVPVAEMSGILVFQVSSHHGMPDRKARDAIHKRLSEIAHENLIIFLDRTDKPSQSLWLWVKRDGTKRYPREHLYVKGQPGDLFVSKISGIVVDINELDERGAFPLAHLADRMKSALDVERVTKKFFLEFKNAHLDFLSLIQGIEDERDQRWYASVLLHRLMFIWFLQKKHFLDGGNDNYLGDKLTKIQQREGLDRYYEHFLKPLFFEGFAKPASDRSPQSRALLGEIKYLNGGLFLPHSIEQNYPSIHVADGAFENLFALFGRYSWNLNDTPGGKDNEINPDVLGYIFEKYINQKTFGAYYTRTEITEYLCEHTIYALILEKINQPAVPAPNLPARQFDSVPELLVKLDAELCRELLYLVLPKLSLLDPACGSGAFLVAAMKTLINLYSAIVGRIKFLNDPKLDQWLKRIEAAHPNIPYFIKKTIITDNLFGVDIMEEATEIAKLRLFLALVSSAQTVDQLEPLPNIDFNIMAGNSLVGLVHVQAEEFEAKQPGHMGDMFRPTYRQILEEKNLLIEKYRHGDEIYGKDLQVLRNNIDGHKRDAQARLNDLLLAEFSQLGIKFEQATWDAAKGKEGKPIKRPPKIEDIEVLHPFHWGYEFDEILNQRGGFDAIITNPPWEGFKPLDKEFAKEYDPEIERRGTNIKDFEVRFKALLKQPSLLAQYLAYRSSFPHVSAWFRASSRYPHQTSVVDGKKTGSDINLYKLFVEQNYNLLRKDGQCGIVIPSGIYSDLGAKGLRDLLFNQTRVTGLFCFENRKEVFEGVHRSFKFVVLTFKKGGETTCFPAAFMRHEVAELARFPQIGAQWMSVELIRRLSPDSHSVMEFKGELDVHIAEKMLCFPLLGEKIEGVWNLRFTREFDMTNDSHLFKTEPGEGRLPLYEGKMIWHFEHGRGDFRYWLDRQVVEQDEVRRRSKQINKLLGGGSDEAGVRTFPVNHPFDYYRIGFRSITGATNERSLVASILPKGVVTGNSLSVSAPIEDRIEDGVWSEVHLYSNAELLVICTLMSSFICDWFIRQKILTNMNMFYVYQIPLPRITAKDPTFLPIATRAARLTCTDSEFDDLAKEIGLDRYQKLVSLERARLRAELDGLIAHLYGLTEYEFAHILTTFPLVPEPVKIAVLNAYRDVERGLVK